VSAERFIRALAGTAARYSGNCSVLGANATSTITVAQRPSCYTRAPRPVTTLYTINTSAITKRI
jgi:hypothetical protein